MWDYGYYADALSLSIRILCRRFWSPTFWGRCAGVARRLKDGASSVSQGT